MALSSLESISQPPHCSIFSASSPCLIMRAFILSSSIGSMNCIEISLYSFRMSIVSCTPSWTTSSTVFSGSI